MADLKQDADKEKEEALVHSGSPLTGGGKWISGEVDLASEMMVGHSTMFGKGLGVVRHSSWSSRSSAVRRGRRSMTQQGGDLLF